VSRIKDQYLEPHQPIVNRKYRRSITAALKQRRKSSTNQPTEVDKERIRTAASTLANSRDIIDSMEWWWISVKD